MAFEKEGVHADSFKMKKYLNTLLWVSIIPVSTITWFAVPCSGGDIMQYAEYFE